MVALNSVELNILPIVRDLENNGVATFPKIYSRYVELHGYPRIPELHWKFALACFGPKNEASHQIQRALYSLQLIHDDNEDKIFIMRQNDETTIGEYFSVTDEGKQYLKHIEAEFISSQQTQRLKTQPLTHACDIN